MSERNAMDRFSIKASIREGQTTIDPTGGRYGAGVIRGVSLCSRGEALGHGMWCDSEFIDQIILAAKQNAKLLKCRFTHPDICSDGLGKSVGTIDNFSRVGDQSIGDINFYVSSHNTPDGDLAGYVMQLAAEDPSNFGMSIVFEHDYEAEEVFENENTQEIELSDNSGEVVETEIMFVSPDEKNTNNLPHARLATLRACDIVDEPAANPNGLFHRKNSLLSQASAMVDYVIGKSDQKPLFTALGNDITPEKVKGYFQKRLDTYGLTLAEKGKEMSTSLDKNEQDVTEEEKEAEVKGKEVDNGEPDKPSSDGCDKSEECTEDGCDPEKKDEEMSSGLKLFCETFGYEDGAKMFLEGVSFADAQGQYIESLAKENKELKDRLSSLSSLGVDPVGFSAAKDKQRDEAENKFSGLSPREQFAAMNATTLN